MWLQFFLSFYILTTFVLTQSCSRNDLIFSRFDNKAINGSTENVLLLKKVQSPELCLGICRNHGRCRSFNVVKENSLSTCHLLSVDRFTLPMINLTTTENSRYFELTKSMACLSKQFKGIVHEAVDCLDIYQKGFKEDGIYEINIMDKKIRILCDMTTPPFGWTIFQKRFDGSINFYRNWTEYKNGFGKLKSEFWLGNEFLHLLTTGKQNLLRIELKRFNGERYSKDYTGFYIGTSNENYKLKAEGGFVFKNAILYHYGMSFSTYDNDNDLETAKNCASFFTGGWWYKTCQQSNLNGIYQPSAKVVKGNVIYWKDATGNPLHTGHSESLQETEIKFRRP